MELTGQKNKANVTLNCSNFKLTIDTAHKVVTLQLTADTKLFEVIDKVDTVLNMFGYQPKDIKTFKIKKFNFR